MAPGRLKAGREHMDVQRAGSLLMGMRLVMAKETLMDARG